MEYFLEVYDKKSYKKASEYFMISQQVINKVVKSLEEELNKKLFIRKDNTLEVTKDAKDNPIVNMDIVTDESLDDIMLAGRIRYRDGLTRCSYLVRPSLSMYPITA